MRAMACVDPANDDKVQSNDKVTILSAWTPLRAGKISALVAEHEDGPKSVCTFNCLSLLVVEADFTLSTGTPLGSNLQRRPD